MKPNKQLYLPGTLSVVIEASGKLHCNVSLPLEGDSTNKILNLNIAKRHQLGLR